MTTTNPLVAQRQDSTTWHTGLQIVDDAASVYDGVSSGNWIEAGLGTLATGMDAVAMATNPIETLISYGLGWLIEHVQPLQDALNWVAGDPDQIAAYAKTWKNVAGAVDQASKDFTAAVNQTAGWSGAAADAYRQYANGKINALTAAATSANTIGTVVEVVGMVVGMVRWQVRTDVTEAIGEVIQDALEELCTLGLGTPVVIAQVVTLVSDWMANIAELLAKLGSTLAKLRPLMSKLEEIWNAIKELLADTHSADAVDGAPHDPSIDPAGDTTAPSSADPATTTTPSSTDPSTPATTGTTTTPSGTDPVTPTDPGMPGDPGTPGDPTGPGPGSGDPTISDNNSDPSANSKPADGTPTGGDPVDVTTGVMLQSQTDLDLPGTLPLVISRTHKSSYRVGRWFGSSWASTLDQQIEVGPDAVHFAAADGMLLVYPLPGDTGSVLPAEGAPLRLARSTSGYTVTDHRSGRVLHFASNGTSHLPIVAITDRNGNQIRFDYNADGTPADIRHSSGYHIAVQTADGLVTELRLRNPRGPDVVVTRYRYNGRRQLTEVVNSSGLPMRFEYDDLDRMTRWEDRKGMWYRYRYDDLGRCVRGEGKDGYLSYTFAYDRENRVTRATNSLGHSTTYHLNELLQVIREIGPLGAITLSEWDAHHRLLARTDPLGNTTRYEYDPDGNLAAVIRPDGSRSEARYNELGLPTVKIDPSGAQWRREYDERGNVVAETDPLGARTTYAHGPRGELVTVTDPLGNRTMIRTNPAGLAVAVHGAAGTTQMTRDLFGRVSTVTDPISGTTRFTWTVEGTPTSRTDPDGTVRRWVHDGEGNAIVDIDPLGQRSTTEFNGFDLPAGIVETDGGRLTYDYDTELRLTAVTNQQSLVWRYEYDAAGNLVRETDFNGRVLTYRHDPAGRLIERTNGVGQTVRYQRDALGNTVEQRAGNAVTTFDYDGEWLVRARNDDAEVVFERDALGRVLSETVNGRTVRSSYDVLGRRTRRLTPSGAESVCEYHANGGLSALHTTGHTIRFEYDAAGREVTRRLGTSTFLTQTWDAGHRLRTQSVLDAGADPAGRGRQLLQRRSFTYRPDGGLATTVDQIFGASRFDVDARRRVTTAHRAGGTERYAYDRAGNITFADGPGAGVPLRGPREYEGTLVSRAGTVRYRHDRQGRVSLRRHDGPDMRPADWHYAWDAHDRLTDVITPDGQRWHYRYDPFGRRVAKERVGMDGSVHDRVDFVWDGLLLAEQQHRDRATTWEWRPGTVRPLSQSRCLLRGAGTSQHRVDEEFYAIVTDLVGTPTELIATNGELAGHAETSLWGNRREHGKVDCPLRFPGQYHDPETGLHYNVHRYYDPATGRYQSADPLGLVPGPNPYAYVSDPMRAADPLGLAPYKVLYHGSQKFEGDKFSLQQATDNVRPGTPNAGVYLTDDFNRAATGYGRGGQVVRVQVPEDFANSIRQLGGPAGNQPEFFVNSQAGIDILNQGITDVANTPDAIRRFFTGSF